LKEDILEHSGTLRRTVADLYEALDESLIKHFRCKDHKLPITCMTISQDCKWLFSASKDCTIVKWCLSTMKRVAAIKRVEKKTKSETKGHKTAIQSLSISTDGKFLASGDQENQVYIWVSFKFLLTYSPLFHSACFILFIGSQYSELDSYIYR
jgi:ribosomal RNA-processing protein 9